MISKKKELLFGAVVILFFFLVTFGITELYFRFFNPQLPAFLRPDPVLGTMHFSNYTVRQNNSCIQAVTHLNKDGMNDVDHETKKPEGVYRVAVIGDSYVEAMQFPLEQAYFKVMENALRERGYTVEVLAFGVGGFGTLQEYYLLRDYALKYDPDLVILSIFTYNDIRNNSFLLEKNLDMPYATLNEDGTISLPDFKLREEYVRIFESPLRTLVFEHSHLVRFVYRLSNQSVAFRNFLAFFHLQTPSIQDSKKRMDDSNELYLTEMSDDWSDAWKVTEELIKKTKDLSEQNHSKFMMYSLSNDVQLSDERFSAVRNQYPQSKLDPELPEKMLSSISERNSMRYFSALPALKTLHSEGVVVHPKCHGHWSPEASAHSGELLADYVEKEFLLQ
jgi:hypothetical protein